MGSSKQYKANFWCKKEDKIQTIQIWFIEQVNVKLLVIEILYLPMSKRYENVNYQQLPITKLILHYVLLTSMFTILTV